MKLSISKLEKDKVENLKFEELVEYANSYDKMSKAVQEEKKEVLEKITDRLKNMSYDNLDDNDLGSFLYRRKSLPNGLGKDPEILKKIKYRAKRLHAKETARGKKPSLDGCFATIDIKKEVADWTFSDCVFYCRDMTTKPMEPFEKNKFKFVMKRYQVSKAALMEDLEEICDVGSDCNRFYKETVELFNKVGACGPGEAKKDGENGDSYVSLENVEEYLKDVQEKLVDNIKDYTLQSVSGFQGKKVQGYTKISPSCIGGKMLKKKIKIINAFITDQMNKISESRKAKEESKNNVEEREEESKEEGKKKLEIMLKEHLKKRKEEEAKEERKKDLNERDKEKLERDVEERRERKKKANDENENIDEQKSVEQLLLGNGSNIDDLIALIDTMDEEKYKHIKRSKGEDIDDYFDEYKTYLSRTTSDKKLIDLIDDFLKPSQYKKEHTADLYKEKRRKISEVIQEKVDPGNIEEYNTSSERILANFIYCYHKISSSASDKLATRLGKSLIDKSEKLAKSMCEALLKDKSLSVLDKSGVGLLVWEKLFNSLKQCPLSGFSNVLDDYVETISSKIIQGLPESKYAFLCYRSSAKHPSFFTNVEKSIKDDISENIKNMSLKDCLFLKCHENGAACYDEKELEKRINVLVKSSDVKDEDIINADIETKYSYLQSEEFTKNGKFKSVIDQIQADFNKECQEDCSIKNLNKYMELLVLFSGARTEQAKEWKRTIYEKINTFLDIYNGSRKNIMAHLIADHANEEGNEGLLKDYIKCLEQIVKQYSNYRGHVKNLTEKAKFDLAFFGYWLLPSDPVAKKARSCYQLSREEIYYSIQYKHGSNILLETFSQMIGIKEDKEQAVAVDLMSQGYNVLKRLGSGSEGAYFLCEKGGKEIAVKGFYSGRTVAVFAEKAAQTELQELAKDNPDVKKYLALSKDNDSRFETEVALEDMADTTLGPIVRPIQPCTFPNGQKGCLCSIELGKGVIVHRFLTEDYKTRLDESGNPLPPEKVKELDNTEGPIVIQPWANGVLVAVAKMKRNETLDKVMATAYQTMKAISLLHQSGFVHGDIKPANIIKIKNNNFNSDKKKAEKVEELFFEGQEEVFQVTDLSMRTIKMAITGVGNEMHTLGYIDPLDPLLDSLPSEAEKEDLVKKGDVYALGKTLLEFMFNNTDIDVLEVMRLKSAGDVSSFYDKYIKDKWYTGVNDDGNKIKCLIEILVSMTAPYQSRWSIDQALDNLRTLQNGTLDFEELWK